MTNPDTEEAHPMLVRVARAIAEARALPGTSPAKPAPWSSDVDKRAARAALSALRDLTPDVVEAINMQAARYIRGIGTSDDVFLVGINHILGESA